MPRIQKFGGGGGGAGTSLWANISGVPFITVNSGGSASTGLGPYGSNTPSTTTNGFQEAIVYAVATNIPIVSYGALTLPAGLNLGFSGNIFQLNWEHLGYLNVTGNTLMTMGNSGSSVRNAKIYIDNISGLTGNGFILNWAFENTLTVRNASLQTNSGELFVIDPKYGACNDNSFHYQSLRGFQNTLHIKDTSGTGLNTQGTEMVGGAIFGDGAKSSGAQNAILLDSGANAGLGAVYGTVDLAAGFAGSKDFNNLGATGGGWILYPKFIRGANSTLIAGDMIYNGSQATAKWANAVALNMPYTGNGVTTHFAFAHGMGATPFSVTASLDSATLDAIGYSVGWDATNVTFDFKTAPASGAYNTRILAVRAANT